LMVTLENEGRKEPGPYISSANTSDGRDEWIAERFSRSSKAKFQSLMMMIV
jgi:hypothetical protein